MENPAMFKAGFGHTAVTADVNTGNRPATDTSF